jgi:hypothetical protein
VNELSLKRCFLRLHWPIKMASGRAFRVSTITWGRQSLPRDQIMLQKKSRSESPPGFPDPSHAFEFVQIANCPQGECVI